MSALDSITSLLLLLMWYPGAASWLANGSSSGIAPWGSRFDVSRVKCVSRDTQRNRLPKLQPHGRATYCPRSPTCGYRDDCRGSESERDRDPVSVLLEECHPQGAFTAYCSLAGVAGFVELKSSEKIDLVINRYSDSNLLGNRASGD
jgi:hypothetical protein